MNKIEKAIIFATRAHAGTCRKGKDKPYILHPISAMAIVKQFTTDEDVLAAAVLHDTVEDVGGKMILPPHGKEFFTHSGKKYFT